jgi:hypothetical protein
MGEPCRCVVPASSWRRGVLVILARFAVAATSFGR